MNSWLLLDVQKLFDSLGEDTTSANVGGYEAPIGPMQRSAPPRRDYEIAADEFEKLLSRKRKKRA